MGQLTASFQVISTHGLLTWQPHVSGRQVNKWRYNSQEQVYGFFFKIFPKTNEIQYVVILLCSLSISLQLAIMSYQRYLFFIIRKCKYVASVLD